MTCVNNKLVLTGGVDANNKALADVWQSEDEGKTWSCATDNAPFGARSFHTMTILGNKLVLTGGMDAKGKKLADVWQSTDNGLNWTNMC
mmetsp:Transcript_47338/g.39970  ORF Transcript_47338/g.39970 Transcript_47338/m.39970 type:complete len:89 (-) Transcript_47338:173-439(-)